MTEYQPYTPGPGIAPTKPGMLTAVAVLTLISGITNILAGLTWIGASIGLMTVVIGFCTLPLSLLPIVLGVFEIIYASKLLANPVKDKISQTIAILEIVGVLSGNIVSLVAGILNLVAMNDSGVKAYYDQIGIPSGPSTPVPM
jgi:hypothetical protein